MKYEKKNGEKNGKKERLMKYSRTHIN